MVISNLHGIGVFTFQTRMIAIGASSYYHFIQYSDFQKTHLQHELRSHCMHNLFIADELLFHTYIMIFKDQNFLYDLAM